MNPNPSSPESVTLAALGLDPPLTGAGQTAAAAMAREVQDTAALTWLSLAELQPAPESIWQSISEELAMAPPQKRASSSQRWRIPTWTGWAAAALIAIGWWFFPRTLTPVLPADSVVQTPSQPAAAPPKPEPSTVSSIKTDANASEAALRQELAVLRERLAAATSPPGPPGLLRPAILELRAPGSSQNPEAGPETAARLQQIVTRALQRDLLLRQPREAGSIILEQGWPEPGWISGTPNQTIRHLSFPADQWEQLGLWKSPDLFYDPATSLTWTPAPDGLGYLGRVSTETPDPRNFEMPGPRQNGPDLQAQTQSTSQPDVREQGAAASREAAAGPPPGAAPAGYLVSEPGTEAATLLLTDLPPVPPGAGQYVIATSADGISQQYLINSFDASLPASNFSHSANLTLSSLSLPGNFTGFSVVQTSTDGSAPTVILTGGAP